MFYQAVSNMSMKRKLNVDALAELVGVGRATISAVRRMLGVKKEVRKLMAEPIIKFLKKYPDFTIADARDRVAMEAFKERHPDFSIPDWIV